MIHYRLAPLAKSDLDEIWFYLAQEGGTELAERIVSSIEDRFETLARMPRSGRARPEISEYMRSFPAGKYLIYYENPPKGRIVISRVLHGKRDQDAALLN